MSWDNTTYKVKLELLEPMLGTTPALKSIWQNHIATKQAKSLKKQGKTEEEIQTELAELLEGVPGDEEMLEAGLTTFLKDETGYYVTDYFVEGFLKSAALVMREWGNLKQLRSKVRQDLQVTPRRIYVAKPDAQLEIIERPLRAKTAQGERVSIARSHAIPAGTILDFQIRSWKGTITKTCLAEILEYGQKEGLGQWRGGGYGRFAVVELNCINTNIEVDAAKVANSD